MYSRHGSCLNAFTKRTGWRPYGSVKGYDDDTVNYHKALLINADLLELKPHYSTSRHSYWCDNQGTTLKGHEFIEATATNTKRRRSNLFFGKAGKDLTRGLDSRHCTAHKEPGAGR